MKARSLKANKSMRFWWVTADATRPRHRWKWSAYFQDPTCPIERLNYGGPKWIRSGRAFQNIGDMRKGDVVVAYQTREGVVGLARLSSKGLKTRSTKKYDTFNLSRSNAIQLEQAMPFRVVRQLPEAAESIQAIKEVNFGAVLAITAKGFVQLFHLMIAFNPSQESQLARFVTRL
jgi:hypothetical protein